MTASPQGRILCAEAEWPMLATKILDLSIEPYRLRGGQSEEVLGLIIDCAGANFSIGEVAINALTHLWSENQSDDSVRRWRDIWVSFENQLIDLSRKDKAPSKRATSSPSSAWATHASILTRPEAADAAPDGVKRGRAE
jgi:hypothetical protein